MSTTTGNASIDVDYMSYVSHELSTPLTAIKWHAELLKGGKMTKALDPDQAKLMNEIMLGVNRMSLLVDDIHESSWLERNKFADEPSPVMLDEAITAAQARQQAAIDGKHLAFTVESEAALPPVEVRPSTLALVVQNLLSNAVKYTPDGGSVTVRARLAGDEDAARIQKRGADCVLLSVTDTGMGIPADQQNMVFTRFFRATNAREQDVEGTGLGLYIVWLGAKSMGGTAWFSSAEQQGSTFWVILPVNIKRIK